MIDIKHSYCAFKAAPRVFSQPQTSSAYIPATRIVSYSVSTISMKLPSNDYRSFSRSLFSYERKFSRAEEGGIEEGGRPTGPMIPNCENFLSYEKCARENDR